jgi:hypothetical protein
MHEAERHDCPAANDRSSRRCLIHDEAVDCGGRFHEPHHLHPYSGLLCRQEGLARQQPLELGDGYLARTLVLRAKQSATASGAASSASIMWRGIASTSAAVPIERARGRPSFTEVTSVA